ncbi:MAG: hypothetical protein ACFCVK_13530 [Acidimicrobiales bacterium]
MSEVLAVLTELLGPPASDEIQVSADVDRAVQWDEPFLNLQLTSWDHLDPNLRPEPVVGGSIFHYYLTTSSRLATEAGVKPGATVGELTAAYPGITFHEGRGDLPREFIVEPAAGWPQLPVFGLLDGDGANPGTTIVHLGAGWDRTPC